MGHRGADECVQFRFHKEPISLFSPRDLMYLNCFNQKNDTELTQSGMDVDPRIVHLGIPGKGMVKDNEYKSDEEKKTIRRQITKHKNHMYIKVWDKSESLSASPVVHRIRQMLQDKVQGRRAGPVVNLEDDDICD